MSENFFFRGREKAFQEKSIKSSNNEHASTLGMLYKVHRKKIHGKLL
jgi:hypothetical protein